MLFQYFADKFPIKNINIFKKCTNFLVKKSLNVDLRGSFRDTIEPQNTNFPTITIQNNFETSNIIKTNFVDSNLQQTNIPASIQPTTTTYYLQPTTPVVTTTYYNQVSSFVNLNSLNQGSTTAFGNPKTTFVANSFPTTTFTNTNSRKSPYSIVTRNYGPARTTQSVSLGSTRSTRNILDTTCEDDDNIQVGHALYFSPTALFHFRHFTMFDNLFGLLLLKKV